jgi:uncharacterized membrane protein
MSPHYLAFFLMLLKISPLFIRLLIDKYWQLIIKPEPLGPDATQAKVIGYSLRAKNIKITDQRLLHLFNILPNHISIDAKERIPALLNQWNIKSTVKDLADMAEPIDFSQDEVEIKFTPNDLSDIQLPCLIRLKNGKVAALVDISVDFPEDKKSLVLYHPDQGIQVISFESLLAIWSSVLFIVNVDEAFEEPKFASKNNTEQWDYWLRPCIILLTLLFLLSVIQFQITHYSGIALFIYLGITTCLVSGLTLSLLLAQYAMGNTTGTVAQHCSNTSNVSCSEILDSPNAKFLGISHADIGVAYFAGSLLLFFISLLTVDAYPYIHSINTSIIYLSFLALIYSGYSIFIQKYQLKKWCPLCLYTQATVAVQALLVFIFIGFTDHTIHNHFSLALSLVLLCAPGLIWYFLRAQFVSKTLLEEQQQQLESIVSSDSIIQQILHSKQVRIAVNQQDLKTENDAFYVEADENLEGDLIISSNSKLLQGDPQALRVVVGLSPSCFHCGSLLEEIYQFINNNNSAIECRIRLIVSEGESQEAINDRIIAEHITAFVANASEGSPVAICALRNWYQDCKAENIKQWLGSVRNINESESIDVSVLLADTSFWVNQKDITVIPAMYIENIHVPFISENYSTILLRKICI